MKCALEMLVATAEDRAMAKERKFAEEERIRKEEEAKRLRILREANVRAEQLVENILKDFEKSFKDYEGDPCNFYKDFILTDITCDWAGYSLRKWWEEGNFYYPIYKDGSSYADGTPSFSSNKIKPINLNHFVTVLEKLCYCCIPLESYISNKRHWGSGNIYFPSFRLKINPQCLEG